MKLLYSQTSPFVRMVRVVAAWHNLGDRLELIPSGLFSEDEATLRAANPLAKIPALILDNGQVIYDSRVIIAYLDTNGTGERLLNPASPDYFVCQTRLALVTGILDAGVSIFLNSKRTLPDMPDAQVKRWETNIRGGIAEAERQLQANDPLFRLCLPCVLDWLSLRLPHINWQQDWPALAHFVEAELQSNLYEGTDPRDT